MPSAHTGTDLRSARRQRSGEPVMLIALAMVLAFTLVGAQVLRLALLGAASGGTRAQLAEPLVRSYARPDVVDRRGRLLATDLTSYSLFADPVLVIDPDEASERITDLLPELSQSELRASLADKSRRFVWIRRQLTPGVAQRIHDFGLPGLAFRAEPRRFYPQGRMAGHVLGSVSVDNRGLAGVERFIDDAQGLETSFSADFSRPPVVLTLDSGAQHALEEELSLALAQYGASGAAGVIMDARSGAILAAASLPDLDPARPGEGLLPDRIDRLGASAYEMGSVLKVFTVAMALDMHLATPASVFDVRVPLQVGKWTIRDISQSRRPLTLREVLAQSSNIGVAQIALLAGASQQRAFLQRVGLIEPIRLDATAIAAPRLPQRWGQTETATIAYGYGVATAPLQVASSFASIVNGGYRVRPHLIATLPGNAPPAEEKQRVLSADTSAKMRDMLRSVVTNGTAKRADVPGFEIGGKTGTAELAAGGGYREKAVVASFLGAFPMNDPRFVVLVSLMEPRPEDAGGRITAGVNAAPIAARVISRAAPILGVPPN